MEIARNIEHSQNKAHCLALIRDVVQSLGKKYWAYFGLTILLALTTLLPPQLFRYFTESTHAIDLLDARGFLWRLGLFGVFVAGALAISTLGGALCQEWLRLTIEAKLRRQVLSRLHRMPLRLLDSAQRGDWITRMTRDLQQVEHFLTDSIPQQIRHIAILVGAATLFIYYSGTIGLIAILTASLIAVFNFSVQKKLAPVLAEMRTLHGNVLQLLIESLEGLRTIRTHSAERFVQNRFESKLKKITSKGMNVVRLFGALMGSNQALSQIMITACLSLAIYGLKQGSLTLQEVLVYPFFIGLFYSSAQALASSAYDWNRYFADGGRLAQLLYAGGSSEKEWFHVLHSSNAVRLDEAQSLTLSDVKIGYSGQSLTKPFGFSVSQGEIVAVTGPSGCGKSTFLEVLAGLRAALDGNGSVQDRVGHLLWQRSEQQEMKLPLGLSAYVEQRPYLFEGSVRENLTFGNATSLKDDELMAAIERVGLEKQIQSAGGLDYVLYDRGQNLSEGQRYRLAIARALLLRRPFLLLDEPFAALDPRSIERVLNIFEAEKEHAGIVVVTHYLPAKFKKAAHFNFAVEESRPSAKKIFPVYNVFGVKANLGVLPGAIQQVGH